MSPAPDKKESASFQAKFCYGRFLYYPKNEKARRICRDLTHTETLTQDQAQMLLSLGVRLKLRGSHGL